MTEKRLAADGMLVPAKHRDAEPAHHSDPVL